MLFLYACTPVTETDTSAKDTTEDLGPDTDGDGVPDSADCAPEDRYVYPGASEIPYDGVDQDCDGEDVMDADGDGYDGAGGGGDDCNDNNPTVNPGAKEVCYNSLDDDCVGDDAMSDDCDDDGSVRGDDCDDEDPTVFPGAEEVWYDGKDGNCDGLDDNDRDLDGIDATEAGGADCVDTDATINPDMTEIWNGVDDDCEGSIDVLYDRDATMSVSGDSGAGESYFGWDYLTIDDRDADGRRDLVVGVPGDAGKVWVLPTKDGVTTTSTEGLASIASGTAGQAFGSSVSLESLDGIEVLAVGAPYPGTEYGAAYFYATASLTGSVDMTSAVAYVIGTDLGGAVDPLRDFDGDGDPEWLVGCGAGAVSTVLYSFESRILGQGGGRTPADAVLAVTGDEICGVSAAVGDLDDDGFVEVAAVSASKDATRLYVISGADTAVLGTADINDYGGLGGADGVTRLAHTDDLDGDGYGELVLGAPSAGTVRLVDGDVVTTGAATVDDVAFATVVGTLGEGADDLDGDGADDMLVCASGTCGYVGVTTIAAGGSIAAATGTPSFVGASAEDLFGGSALVEDIDADGDADVFVTTARDPGGMALFVRAP